MAAHRSLILESVELRLDGADLEDTMDSLDPAVETRETTDETTEMTHARLMALLVDSVEEYAIFMLDPNGLVATWNKGAHRIKGYRAEEIIGRHFSEFYTPEDVCAGKPERELADAVRNGQSRDEGWRLRQDGSRFWANVTITAVFDAAGRLDGFAKVTRDDTDRKQMDEQLRQLELLSERERIAKAMHEKIVHRIFEASMMMENALGLITNPVATQRITGSVATLDETLKEIRAVVLALDVPLPMPR